jgi:beta-lactamase regulating signal transducer with metallopeptidase domain
MTSLAIAVLVKATLVCGTALLLTRVLTRSRASIRHLLHALAFASLVVIPVAATVLPLVVVTVRVPERREAPRMTAIAVANSSIEADPQVVAPAQTEPPPAPLTMTGLIATVWVAGAAIFLVPVVAGLWQVRRLHRGALPWAAGQELLKPIASARGIGRRVEVLRHEALTGPITCGLFTPAIVFPANAESWDAAALTRSFTHELEHVARYDWLTHCLARCVCAPYWFHPKEQLGLKLESTRGTVDVLVIDRAEMTTDN